MTRPRPSLRTRLLLLLGAALAATLLGEGLLRLLWRAPEPQGQLFYQDSGRNEATGIADAVQRGIAIPVDPSENPRGRYRWAPDSTFYMCYRDHRRLHREWLDELGCVQVRTNRWGLRERDEITPDSKGPDEKRVVCVGDSFTFGWGVPVELCWVRLLETGLRERGSDVRTVNCGAAGALVADEYWWAFEKRFAAFRPDAVIVTLCLNDLLPSSGLCLIGPTPPPTGSLLVDRIRALVAPGPLDLDPEVDWVGMLLGASRQELETGGLIGHDKPWEAMWSQQGPQQAITAFQSWCRARQVPLMVVLWPFFQGLGPGKHYPFRRMHELVATFCAEAGVPFLDLLPVFSGQPAETWWVTPADMHANPSAHRVATEHIKPFVQSICAY